MTARDPMQAIADAWLSGHMIGSFELRGAVSRSASGIVYRAWDHGLATAVAIKEHFPTSIARRLANGDVGPALPNAGTAYDGSLKAFVEGTRTLARCDHPALVRVLHLHTGHGTAYRVMPWVDGEPLRERRYGMSQPPDEPMLRALLDDLLGALEAVHRTGIVHGGVHPSQIMLLRNERALLLGPCAVTTDAGGAPGPWTDLRALADVVRFCIGGMPPTPEGQPVEPTAKVVERLLFDDGAVHYGQDFMRVLDAAAAPDIAQRPQSVAQFREQLRQAARIDAGAWEASKAAPAEARQPDGGQSASDASIASMFQRVIDEAIPPRKPAKPRPLRPELTSAPMELPPRAASEPFIDETDLRPMRKATAPRRRAGIGARVFAVVLAVVGYGAWQWLYKPVPTDVTLAVAELAALAPSVEPSIAPVVAAPPPEAVRPVIESVSSSAATEAAPPVAAFPVEPKSAAVEQAAARPAPAAAPAPARSPREACGERTQFSLYLCMQQQCARTGWANHPQCVRFKATDEVE